MRLLGASVIAVLTHPAQGLFPPRKSLSLHTLTATSLSLCSLIEILFDQLPTPRQKKKEKKKIIHSLQDPNGRL